MSDPSAALVRVEMLTVPGSHENIRFTVLGREWISDSYYFDIDAEFERRWPNLTPEAFGRRCLHAVFRQWLDLLRAHREAAQLFLPFDLSDQGTAMLRVQRLDDDRLSLNVGWSSLEGHSIVPSALSPMTTVPSFREELPADVVVPLQLLENGLAEVISALAAGELDGARP